MKKTSRQLRKFLSVTISMLLVLSSIIVSGSVQLVANAGVMSINDLKAKFPQGAYWNHVVTAYENWGDVLKNNWDNSYADTYTWTRCATHNGNPSNGQTDCNAFAGSIQCCGFAKKLAYDIYGSICTTWESTKDKSRIKRGDVVHYYGSNADAEWGHWVFIIDVNGDALTVGECNSGDRCNINWGRVIYKSSITVNDRGNIYIAPYIAPISSHTCKYTGKVTKQPTCTETGVKTYTCSCGKSYTEKIPASGHKYVNTFVPPTTSVNGYTLHKCSICGNSYKSNYVTYKDGWYYCDTLPAEITSDKYKIEYNNYYEKTQATSPGSGWTKEKLVSAKWVNSGEQYTTEYPLETSNSRVCVKDVYYHFCIPGAGYNSEANYEATSKFAHYDEIPVSEHTIVTWSGDDEGHTVYVLSWNNDHTIYCKSGDTCDGSWGNHDYRSKAWYRHCTYQNRVYQEYYKYTKQSGWISTSDSSAVKVTCRYKPIHSHSYTTKVIAPTCTEKGYTLHTCSGCGNSFKDTYTNATGHNYLETVIDPTCIKQGYKIHTCTRCEDSYKDAYTEPLGHNYTETTVQPKTTEQGYTLHTCSRCGDSYKDNFVDFIAVEGLTLSKSSVEVSVGQTTIVTATVKPDNATDKNVIWSSTDNSVATVTDGVIKGIAKGQAIAIAKTSNGLTSYVIVNVKSTAANLTNLSSVSDNNVLIGATVTLNGEAEGGSAPYSYAFMYKAPDATSWKVIGTKFGTSDKETFKPTKAGTYEILISVKDSTGKTESKKFSLTVKDNKLANKSSVSGTDVPCGTKITITGAAEGGEGTYLYTYQIKKPGKTSWTTLGDKYGTDTSKVFTTKLSGAYEVRVLVKDGAGTVKSFTATVNSTGTLLTNNSTISATKAKVGDKVTLAAVPEGGTEPYRFTYEYKKPGSTSWKTKGKRGATYKSVTLDMETAGTYEARVYIQDASDYVTVKTFKVTVS